MDAIKILGSLLSSQLSNGRGNSDLLGSILGGVLNSGGKSNSNGGGLEGILGSLAGQLGGKQQNDQQRQEQSGRSGGGLLGGLLGGGKKSSAGNMSFQQQGNPLEAILGGLKQGGGHSMDSQGSSDLGKLVMGALGGLSSDKPEPANVNLEQFDSSDAQDEAKILIRAMTNAAKSDGEIDEQEQQKILGELGDVTQDEVDFIKQELQSSLDVDGFIDSVPSKLQAQVYAMSLMTIKLDNKNEANYLHQLAQGFDINPQQVNKIHEQMKAPKLYS